MQVNTFRHPQGKVHLMVHPGNAENIVKHHRHLALGALIGLAAVSFSGSAVAFDEAAAKALAKRNDCTKCHAIDKDKRGPSYRRIAAKYSGKPDAEARLTSNLTSRPKVKLSDGTEVEHKVVDTKDAQQIKNLLQWILAQ